MALSTSIRSAILATAWLLVVSVHRTKNKSICQSNTACGVLAILRIRLSVFLIFRHEFVYTVFFRALSRLVNTDRITTSTAYLKMLSTRDHRVILCNLSVFVHP